MPYNETIHTEAQYVHDLGLSAAKDKFHAIYCGILSYWFPASRGYIIDLKFLGDGENPNYIVVRTAGGYRNPLLIVELKPPSSWTAAGKNEVWEDLKTYIEGQFELTKYDTIYGVGGIGLHWTVYKMEKSEGPKLVQVLDWQDNIASDVSYSKFQTIADLVYGL